MTAGVLALLREARKRAGAALVAEEKERGFSSDPDYPEGQGGWGDDYETDTLDLPERCRGEGSL